MTPDSKPTAAGPPRRRWQFNFWTLAEVVAGCGLASAFFAELGWGSLCIIVPAILIVAVCGYLGTAKYPLGALGRVFAAGVIGLVLMCFFGSMLLPINIGRGIADANDCRAGLRRLAIALRTYHDDHGAFPPAVVSDEAGRPMHSWRTLILPYLEESAAYDAYDFSQPWDSAVNRAAAALLVSRYGTCPADVARGKGQINHFMVVGRERLAADQSSLRLSDIHDAEHVTLLLVESDSLRVDWFEPRDLTVDQVLQGVNPPGPGMSSHHRTSEIGRNYAIVNAAFVDGSVRALPETLDRGTWRALLTIAGGEQLDPSTLAIPSRTGTILWLCLLTAVYLGFVIIRRWGPAGRGRFPSDAGACTPITSP